MGTPDELEAKIDRLESELTELKSEVDGAETFDDVDVTDERTAGMTRRGLLGVGGLMGLGGLLGAGAATDTARAQAGSIGTSGNQVDVYANALDGGITGGNRLESLVGNETYIENGELRVSGGGGGGVGDGLAEKLEIIADPPATSLIETGAPSGDPHGANGWGPVFEVHEPTHWRGATVDADAAATAEFAVYEMSDDPFTVDSSDPYRSREFQLSSGAQFVPLEMYLEPGVYHFCQRSGTAIRRVSSDTDWDSLNSADAPIEFVFGSWHYDRDPGMDGQEVLDAIKAGNEDSILGDVNDDFAQIFESDWDSNLHYVADWDVGHE